MANGKCAKCNKLPYVTKNGTTSGYCQKHMQEVMQGLYQVKQQYDYRIVIEAQGGKCAICRNPPPEGKMLRFDHDHNTGKFRGLLCTTCNMGLGMFQDSSVLLREAAMYLEEPNGILPFLAGRFLEIEES